MQRRVFMTGKSLPTFPNLDLERALWVNGALWVAGIDEAGRGALAGPVSVAAVILPQIKNLTLELSGVRDSKMMTANQREYWSRIIREIAVSYGIGLASSTEIDLLGILPATKLAAQRAVGKLSIVPSYLLIDYFDMPHFHIPQISVPKGDMISLSIAAASILAKTKRDEILEKMDFQYPGYGFVHHKGYGTKTHLTALKSIGPTPEHRKSFEPLKSSVGHYFPTGKASV
jgi:ribonuclease HII